MKILHTSDWHLGMTSSAGFSYEEDQRFFISEIKSIIQKDNIETVLLAGDVFDRSIASPEALRLYNETMKELCSDLGVKVLLIAGNHDGPDRISSCHELLESSGLYICGTLSSTPYVVNLGDTDVYMIPWITTERVRFAFPDKADEVTGMTSAYQVVLDNIRNNFVPGHKNILMAHAFVAGAGTSTSDRAAEVGFATQIGADLFDGFDYVALGHIHGPQNIGNNIRYSGTPMIYSFGKEEKQEKSVTVIDTEKMDKSIIPIKNLRGRNTLVGTYEELLEADFPEDVVNGYVRLEVTDRYVGHESADKLIARYPYYIEMKSKNPELSDAKVTMSLDELEEIEDDPVAVFSKYCDEMMGITPSVHTLELFEKAYKEYAKEVSES